MSKTFEKTLRDSAGSELVGSQFVVRVLADWGGTMDLSIRPLNEDTRITDLQVSGNTVAPHED